MKTSGMTLGIMGYTHTQDVIDSNKILLVVLMFEYNPLPEL